MRRSSWTTSGGARPSRPRGCGTGSRRLLNDAPANIALGQNTHELVTRWLSALPWRERRRLITTDGEFHTIRRQIDRLAEEGLDVIRIAARPADESGRPPGACGGCTHGRGARVVRSFQTAEIVPGLGPCRRGLRAARRGAPRRCVPPSQRRAVRCRQMGLASAFVTGGGYKYLPARRGQLLSARAARLHDAAGADRMVCRVHGARPVRPARRRGLWSGRRRLRRRDLRSDVALSSGGGVRVPRGARTDA